MAILHKMTETNVRVFEKVLRNVEILRMIYQLLDFEHQLKLASVSRDLLYFFRTFIWTDTYRTVAITKNQHNVSICNNLTSKDVQLSLDGLEYFLIVFAEDMEDLIERHDSALDCHKMRNLKSISYNHMIITNHHMEMLAKYCPKLERLEIYGCCNKKREIIRFGLDLKVHTLMEMPALKCFSLKTGSAFRGKQRALQDILNHLKLQYNNLKENLLSFEATEDTGNLPTPLRSLEELHMYGPFSCSTRVCNLQSYLNYFENLTHLALAPTDAIIGNELITSLASCCKNLEKLSFDFTNFEGITHNTFKDLAALKDLSFQWCKGLTYDNLREILSEMHLVKFSSIYTKYHGLFQYYFVSPTLKSIHIDAFHSFEFRSA